MDTKEVKKILVKLPRNNSEVFSTFPFLVTLSEEFPKAEINIISEDNGSAALTYLPFKLKVFERPAHKVSLIETHHYCANLHDIFNIDLYFDLENSLNSAFMGFNFRAKERVGYEVKWNKYFLTKRFPDIPGLSTEKKAMKLLELTLEKNLADVRISKSKESGSIVEKVDALFKLPDPPKFIMIMLDNFINVSRQIETWKAFFDSFENQKFVIWSKDDEGVISDLFASIDLGKNNLYMHRGIDPKEMIYLMGKVQGVITNNIWAEGLCTYFGIEFMSFLESEDSLPQYDYFKFKPRRVIINPIVATTPSPIKVIYLDEVREMEVMNELVDLIHFNFKL